MGVSDRGISAKKRAGKRERKTEEWSGEIAAAVTKPVGGPGRRRLSLWPAAERLILARVALSRSLKPGDGNAVTSTLTMSYASATRAAASPNVSRYWSNDWHSHRERA